MFDTEIMIRSTHLAIFSVTEIDWIMFQAIRMLLNRSVSSIYAYVQP